MTKGPIILIEDDPDDHALLLAALKELNEPRDLIWFHNGEDAIIFLRGTTEQPFLILCDINMPKRNGVDVKRTIDSDPLLRQKSIPFIFYSTSASKYMVNQAYMAMTVQGFFLKEHDFELMVRNLRIILDYWEVCIHPNS